MRDYGYPSVFFAYFFFALLVAGALFFLIRSVKDGYWSEKSEEPKYRMLEEDEARAERRPSEELRRRL